ncbi:hypothetical protein PAAG_12541 [Paracoccidioides lutzii Pb01]|uniref:Uncharacterized protein n=1 Tax=Paracoccidioides lutzii (strain ATCC MYA-826 / Pb01) TaxID=502779 RepID=A0A0A2UYY6_PARBA|nr:hypothetical protein PAAG_12541 [Paracoccidioides lutzii Pb01]KGQ00781.1 hypothetical protein PAAG_12541 [Paracoccidioides lutzii Pb01]
MFLRDSKTRKIQHCCLKLHARAIHSQKRSPRPCQLAIFFDFNGSAVVTKLIHSGARLGQTIAEEPSEVATSILVVPGLENQPQKISRKDFVIENIQSIIFSNAMNERNNIVQCTGYVVGVHVQYLGITQYASSSSCEIIWTDPTVTVLEVSDDPTGILVPVTALGAWKFWLLVLIMDTAVSYRYCRFEKLMRIKRTNTTSIGRTRFFEISLGNGS